MISDAGRVKPDRTLPCTRNQVPISTAPIGIGEVGVRAMIAVISYSHPGEEDHIMGCGGCRTIRGRRSVR